MLSGWNFKLTISCGEEGWGEGKSNMSILVYKWPYNEQWY